MKAAMPLVLEGGAWATIPAATPSAQRNERHRWRQPVFPPTAPLNGRDSVIWYPRQLRQHPEHSSRPEQPRCPGHLDGLSNFNDLLWDRLVKGTQGSSLGTASRPLVETPLVHSICESTKVTLSVSLVCLTCPLQRTWLNSRTATSRSRRSDQRHH